MIKMNQRLMIIIPLFHIIAFTNFITLYETINLTCLFFVYFGMMFGVHAGFHRYVTHHSWDGLNWFCGFICLLGCLSFQNGPLWWATHHKNHHNQCEKEKDIHSPNKGFYQSHVGWLFSPKVNYKMNKTYINYFLKNNKLILYLNNSTIYLFINFAYNMILYYINGFTGIICYWIYPIILCWHMTWATNSICHYKNEKEICSPIDNAIVGILNLGEGFHKNHHKNPRALCHGFRSIYQIDIIYLVLKVLSYIGLVTKIK